MQAITRFAAVAAVAVGPAVGRNVLRPLPGLPVRLAAAFTRFIAHDRDRWVSVVCVAGFTLLMWADWLAA